jgi:polyhydroxyalkanoate synthase
MSGATNKENNQHQDVHYHHVIKWKNWLDEYSQLVDKAHKFLAQGPSSFAAIKPEESYANLSNMAKRYAEYWQHLSQDPAKIIKAQVTFTEEMMKVWQQLGLALLGQKNELTEPKKDKRFKAEEWDNNPVFVAIRQAYFATAHYLLSLTNDVEGLNPKTAAQVRFYTQQFIDALSPTNFVMTNPEILKKTIESSGTNLIKGFNNMLDDLRENAGRFHIKMTDTKAFEVGKNVATTKGRVVFQNDMIQLIQYEPTTEKVGTTPLLIVPPWINKYYILDLQPENSLVKFAIDQGNTTFIISWVNPDERYRNKGFQEYMKEGSLVALDQIEKITGQKQTNVVAFCIGGTLMGCTAAYLAAKKQQDRIKSLTFLATLLDFSIPGDLGVFIDDEHLKSIDGQMAKSGYLDGRDMRMAFNLLRSNDLIWNYYVSNYLGGETPFPFDLLYWNCDCTNLPEKMHSFYLHEMYNHNRLVQPGSVVFDNTPLDIRKITIPAYFISTEFDHIAPWDGTYLGANLFGGKTKFVLGGSGHIAGIVNPPVKEKYGYRTNDKMAATSQEWYESSEAHPGSWWSDWEKWIKPFMGDMIPARKPGKGLEAAPGSYVQKKLE